MSIVYYDGVSTKFSLSKYLSRRYALSLSLSLSPHHLYCTSMIEKRAPIQNGSIRKRTPHRPASVPSDIYISHKSIPAVVIKRVRQLMVNER